MQSNRSPRSGFTLVEVLLVLAVIAIFMGAALPSVMRMYGQQKLTQSAERVRQAINIARIQAIETGVIYQFCCESNGTNYVAVPYEADNVNASVAQPAATGGQPVAMKLNGRGVGRLPNGIVFSSSVIGVAGAGVAASGSHKIPIVFMTGLPNAGELSNLNWSPPILFKPDGSAMMDAEVQVSDTKKQFVKLRVRSITGAVSMARLTMATK